MSVVNDHSGRRAEQPDAHTAELELTGFESRYRLTLVLERDEGPRPKTRVFLDRSEDACGADNLWVESKNGDILIKKGDPDTDVYIKDDDSSNAPDAEPPPAARSPGRGAPSGR